MLPWQPFLAFYIWGAHWRHLNNATEPSMCGGLMSNYFDHLLRLIFTELTSHNLNTTVTKFRCGLLLQTELRDMTVGRSACRGREPCKNGWTDRDAFWLMDSDGPKKPYVICWCWYSHVKGPFWGGRGGPLFVQYRDSLSRKLCRKRLNRSRCRLVLVFGWAQGTMY